MIAQWENKCISVCPPCGLGSIPGHGGGCIKDLFLTDHILPARTDPARQKMAQSPLNCTTKPVEIEEGGRSPTTDRE